MTGMCFFRTAANREELSWDPQPRGRWYEIRRSDRPDFSSAVITDDTERLDWRDSELPAAGSAFFYQVRALEPSPGSWDTVSGE